MTISSEVSVAGPYAGNGTTTVFPYGFKIVDETHLRVVLRDPFGVSTDLSLDDGDYSVSGVGSEVGGNVMTSTAPLASYVLTILRNPPFTQETDLENQGPYSAEVVEARLDLATMQIQAVKEIVTRAYTVEPGQNPPSLDLVLAAAQNAAAAAQSASDAADSAQLAQAFADEDEDEEVEPGLFSAKHWTLKAQGIYASLIAAFDNTVSGLTIERPSRADAIANLHPISAPDFIRVAGYAAAGDGGSALYKKVASQPSHAGKLSIILFGGLTVWFELTEIIPSVKMFGAVGDGTTNDATAITNAIAFGKSLYFPAGTYRVNTAITPAANTLWFGDGVGQTIIKGGGSNKVVTRIEANHLPTTFNIAMRDFTIDGNGYSGEACHFAYFNELSLENMEFKGSSGSTTGVGLKIEECYIWMASKCRFHDNSFAGIHLPKGTKNLTGGNNGVIFACDFIGNNFAASFGVIADTVQNLLIEGCDFEGSNNGNKAIDIRNCEGVSIRDNYIELWANGAIVLDGGGNKRVLVEGNVINANSTYICDLNTSGTPNSNIEFRQNRFADATGGQTCVRIGNAFDVPFGGNDRASASMCDKYAASPKAGGILSQSATYNVPAIAGKDGTTTTISVSGARPGDPVQVGYSGSPASLQWAGQVTANDIVTVNIFNSGTGATSGGTGILTAAVRKIH